MKVRAIEENFIKKRVIRNLINIVTVLKALKSGSEMLAASFWMLDDWAKHLPPCLFPLSHMDAMEAN